MRSKHLLLILNQIVSSPKITSFESPSTPKSGFMFSWHGDGIREGERKSDPSVSLGVSLSSSDPDCLKVRWPQERCEGLGTGVSGHPRVYGLFGSDSDQLLCGV